MKKTIILAIAITLASTAFAERNTFRDRSENWLQRNNTEETTGNGLRGAPTISGNPTNPTTPGPVGGGMAIMLALGAGYGLVCKQNKKVANL
ncbi:hypothetical protein FACS189413_13230 [Bacteroidia bacterium]|nr:hypothetical protein FACS189413_13230 [Bacteroidia bacterium]